MPQIEAFHQPGELVFWARRDLVDNQICASADSREREEEQDTRHTLGANRNIESFAVVYRHRCHSPL